MLCLNIFLSYWSFLFLLPLGVRGVVYVILVSFAFFFLLFCFFVLKEKERKRTKFGGEGGGQDMEGIEEGKT